MAAPTGRMSQSLHRVCNKKMCATVSRFVAHRYTVSDEIHFLPRAPIPEPISFLPEQHFLQGAHCRCRIKSRMPCRAPGSDALAPSQYDCLWSAYGDLFSPQPA